MSVEPQEEMEEVLTEEAQEIESQEDNQEAEEQESKPEVNQESPEFKAGMEAMKAQMQEAVNKRISKEVGKRKQMENQFMDFQTQIEELKKSVHQEKPAPQLKDYESEEDFVSAMIEHKMGTQKKTPAPKQPQVQMSPSEIAFAQKEAEYAKSHPGYYAKVQSLNPFIEIKPELRDIIFDTEPDVANYLADNLDLVDQLITLSPGQMGRQISKIEDQFKRTQPLPKKAKPKPAPAVEQNGGTTAKTIDQMSQAEYNKYMANL